MKVKVNLTNQTLECLDNKPYIQGYDTRNKLIVYVPTSVVFGEGDNIQIAYQLQNGRNTIKLPNNGIVEATLEDNTTPNPDYIEGYNGFIFNAFTNTGEPLAVANQAGNFTATLVFKVGTNTYKLNVLNTVLKSTDFEEFESALEGVAQEVLASLETMSDIVTELQETVDDIAANDFSEEEAKELFYTKTQSDSKFAKFKLITNIANIPTETLEALEVGDILVSGGYAYMVLKGVQALNNPYSRYIYGIENTNTLKVYWYEKESVSSTTWFLRILTYPLYTSDEQTKLNGIEAGAQVNIVEGIKVNGTAQTPDENKIISLTIPTNASDVSALPNTTKYCASCDLTINSSTYVMTLQLKDQDGNNLGTAKTVDLPLETMVVSGSYDSTNKKVILTLQNGQTIEFSVADLVSGLQTEITAQNKLSSDLVDDTGHTNKFVNADEKTRIGYIGYLYFSSTSDISHSSTNPTTLTNEQIGEIQKQYCIIKLNKELYYKKSQDGYDYTFEALNLVYNVGLYRGWYLERKSLYANIQTKTIYRKIDVEADAYTPEEVNNLLALKQDLANLVTSWSGTPSDSKYPSEKLVKDSLDAINTLLESVDTTDSTTAYSKQVPSSAKGLVTLNKIGGMSYKCKNLFDNTKILETYSDWKRYGYFAVQPNTTYTISNCGGSGTSEGIAFLDQNKNAISATHFGTSTTFITPANCYYISCDLTDTPNSDFMLNEGTTALPYEEHFDGLHHSEVTKVTSVGTNVWDEETELGTIDGNGQAEVNNNRLRSKNYTRVEPSKTYYFLTPTNTNVFAYDINKNPIGFLTYSGQYPISNVALTMPSNCYYIKITTFTTYGTTYNHDICINVSNSAINGNYYQYEKHELDIPSGARVKYGVNENCHDYIDFDKKEKHVVCGIVDLGSLTYTYNATKQYFVANVSDVKKETYNVVCNALSPLYEAVAYTTVRDTLTDMVVALTNGSDSNIYVRNTAYNDATAFKTAMSGVYLVYELATPTVTDISDILTEQHLPIQPYGTLTFVDYYDNAVPSVVTYDNGLVEVVKTNHEHDIEQQKEIDLLEQFKASKQSILDKMSYDATNDMLTIGLGDDLDFANILFANKKVILEASSDDDSETNVYLDEDKIVLEFRTDWEEDNVVHSLKLDQDGLTYDGARLDTYYVHNIRLTCNNSTVDELSFKLLRRTDTQLALADLKSEVVSYLKALDVVAKINNGNYYYSPAVDMSFYDSSETTLAFNVTFTTQLADKSLSNDSVDVSVAEVINVTDTVREL